MHDRPQAIVRNERGTSIVGSIFAFIILGVMGAALVSLVSVDQESRMRFIERARAFYAVQAGLEVALREIDQGGEPIVEEKSLGADALFTVAIKPASREIVVTGLSGEARRTHTITTDALGGDCLQIDTAGAALGGSGNEQLVGVVLRQVCLSAVTVTELNVALAPASGETVRQVRIGGALVYDDAAGELGEIDITDTTIEGDVSLDVVLFSSGIVGKSVDLTFACSDSSTTPTAQMTF